MTDLDADAASDRLLAAHAATLDRALGCAEAVAAGFEGAVDGDPATTDSRAVRANLRTAFDRAGLPDAFAALLPDVVAAAGATMGAPPVAAPPYVAVTSRGPVLRATLDDARLVVRITTFDVVDGAFVWRDPSAESALSVEVRT